jgi:sugar O-acyltransferase (sialic acid O-acetyltransferase NeuD family)
MANAPDRPGYDALLLSAMEAGDVLIWGAGGHARVVADILRLRGMTLLGFVDDVNPERKGEIFEDAQILGGREVLESSRRRGTAVIIAIGDNDQRLQLALAVRELGLPVASAIHPSVIIASTARIGEGVVLCANAVVGPRGRVGDFAIVNTAGVVDHDCVLEEGAHVSVGVHMGGGARVGRASLVGIGATLLDGCVVGNRTIVGAGSVVVRDLPDEVVAYGVPARAMRSRT